MSFIDSTIGFFSFWKNKDDTSKDIPEENEQIEQIDQMQIDQRQEIPQKKKKKKNYLHRPQTFDEFVDNEKIKERLKIAIKAAKIRGEVPGHVLLYAQAGCGKTTLSRIIANELNGELIETVGSSIKTQKDILEILFKIKIIQQEKKRNAVLFLDECHGLSSQENPETVWFPIFEEFIFYHNLKDDEKIKLTHPDIEGYFYPDKDHFEVEPFMIVGATTDSGLLSKPLRDRFQLSCSIQPYREKDIKQIALNYCHRAKIGITDDAAEALSKRTRANPRKTVNAILACRDRMLCKSLQKIDKAIVLEQFESEGIDEHGLSVDDYKILKALAETEKGVGLRNLAGTIGISELTIGNQLEPYLKNLGLMKVTSRRIITNKGLKLLEEKNEK